MFVVAITRLARPPEEEASVLAAWFEGVLAYEMRLRLSAPVPIVFAREEDPERARALLARLRERGHGALACDESFVLHAAGMFSPEHYAFGADALEVLDPPNERRMPYADIVALIRAGAVHVEERSRSETKKKLDVGRAVLTGGLVFRKKVTTEHRDQTERREEVLYVIRRDGREPLLLEQGRLRHGGLGDEAAVTSHQNFQKLVAALRQRAPDAFYDERLLARRRATSMAHVGGTSSARVVSSSNASENDLAAHLLVMAHLKGAL